MNNEELLSDWDAVLNNLPSNWKDLCRDMGVSSVGNYVFTDPEVIMKVMLCYLMSGESFKTVSRRAVAQGLLEHVSDAAILNKFRKCGDYFKELSTEIIKERTRNILGDNNYNWVVRAVDGTYITAPEGRANNMILHTSINVLNGVIDHIEVTDAHEKETIQRFPVGRGEIILADRGYGYRSGVSYVVERGGHIIVRVNADGLPCFNMNGSKFDFLSKFNGMSELDVRSFDVFFDDGKRKVNGRICVLKRSSESAARAIKEMTRNAQKHGKKPSEKAKDLAKYVYVFTSLSEGEMSKENVLKLYRMRWQIEIYFKKLKSLLDVGTPPTRSSPSLVVWIYGKILATLLIEGFADSARPFSPSAWLPQ